MPFIILRSTYEVKKVFCWMQIIKNQCYLLFSLHSHQECFNLFYRMYYSKCNVGYVLRAEIGEELQEAMRLFAQAVNIKAAHYHGIGTVNQVELAFFCTDLKVYDRKFFNEDYELVSLMGNLSTTDEVVTPHTHVTLGDRNFQTFSGHLVRAVVSLTAEIIVTPIDLTLTRKEDPLLKYKELVFPRRTHLKIDV